MIHCELEFLWQKGLHIIYNCQEKLISQRKFLFFVLICENFSENWINIFKHTAIWYWKDSFIERKKKKVSLLRAVEKLATGITNQTGNLFFFVALKEIINVSVLYAGDKYIS